MKQCKATRTEYCIKNEGDILIQISLSQVGAPLYVLMIIITSIEIVIISLVMLDFPPL